MLLLSIPALIAALAAKTASIALRLKDVPAINAWSWGTNSIKALLFPWKKNGSPIIYPITEYHYGLVRPDHKNGDSFLPVLWIHIAFNTKRLQFFLYGHQNRLRAKDLHSRFCVVGIDDHAVNTSVAVEVASSESGNKTPIYRGKTEGEGLVWSYPEPIERCRQMLVGNQKPSERMLFGWVGIKLNWMICLHRFLQPKKVIGVFHPKRDGKLPTCYGSVCGDKAEPVGFRVGINDIEKRKISLILNWPVGANVSPLRNVYRIGVYHVIG